MHSKIFLSCVIGKLLVYIFPDLCLCQTKKQLHLNLKQLKLDALKLNMADIKLYMHIYISFVLIIVIQYVS